MCLLDYLKVHMLSPLCSFLSASVLQQTTNKSGEMKSRRWQLFFSALGRQFMLLWGMINLLFRKCHKVIRTLDVFYDTTNYQEIWEVLLNKPDFTEICQGFRVNTHILICLKSSQAIYYFSLSEIENYFLLALNSHF